MPTRIPSRLIKDLDLKLEDMQPDFLEGQDWNITNGNNNATITGLKPGTNPNDVATVQNVLNQFDNLSFQNPVINMTTTDPSTLSPSEGDRYIVASGATGSWSGHDNQIAEYRNGSWTFIIPGEGYEVYDLDTNKFYVFNNTNWVDLSNYISGSGGSIPGNTGDVMWNNSGSLGADSNFNYDSPNQILKIGNLRFDGANGRYYVDSGNLGLYIPDGQVLNMYFNNNLTYIISQNEINMNNHAIVNVPDPVNDQDVANKRYVDSAVNSVSYTFDSGIHEIAGSEVILGGQILYATIIDTNNQQFKIKNDQSTARKPQIIFDSDYVAIGNMDNDNSGYGNIIRFLQDKIVIVSGPSGPSDGAGLYYDSDYSSLNTNNDRWIPDWGTVKDYVDNNSGGSAPGNDHEVILNVGGSFGTSPDIYADYNAGVLTAKSYQASDSPSYLMSSYELQIKSGTALSLRVIDVEMIGIDSNYVYNRTILDMTNHRIVNLADPTDNLDAVNLNYFNNHKFDAPGNDQQVIFNENGSLSTNANFTYDYNNDVLQVGSILLDGNNAYVRSNYSLNLESAGSGYNLLLRVAGNTISEFDEYNQYLYRTLNMTHNQVINVGYLELDKGSSLVDFGGTALLNGVLDVETQTDGNSYYSRLSTLNIRKAVNSGVNDNGYAVGFWVQAMPDSNIKAHDGYLRSEYSIQVQYGLYRTGHTGTIDRAAGIVISPYHQSGTINNSYGLWITAPSTGGTVGNYYPIYVTNNSGTVYLGSFTRINGNLDMINHQVKNVLDPTDNLDAVNLQYFNAHRLDAPGNDQEILFNNSGTISTDPNFTYDYTQNILNVGSILLDQGEVKSNSGIDLQLQTNDTTRLVVKDSSGYVGINKPDPDEYLDVSGYIKSSNGFIIKRTTFTVPASTQDYYRIATAQNRVGGRFRVRWEVSGQSGTIEFYAGIHYGDASPFSLIVYTHDYSGTYGITRVRLLEAGANDIVYLDIQMNNANASDAMSVIVEQLTTDFDGWNLQDSPTGGATVPSGYSSHAMWVPGRIFRTPWHQMRTNGDFLITGYFQPGQAYKSSDGSVGVTQTIRVLADDPGTAYVIDIKDGIITSVTSTSTTLT